MRNYIIPSNYLFRLHQVRPRFKSNVENVLLYVATELSKIEQMPTQRLNQKFFDAIRLYPKNITRSDKTIHNWRTEIAALFGFIEEDNVNKVSKPGVIAKKLAKTQDLVQFFKYFLFYFQYPGGHIKSHKLSDVITMRIKFKPAQYFLKVLEEGEKKTKKHFSLNKAEATHFIYNDLRVTRDNCLPIDVVDRLLTCRENNLELNWQGDVIRYAGDILDYMVLGDLLVKHGSNYYINWADRETITAFLESDAWFTGYDHLYGRPKVDVSELKTKEDDWFRYVNKDLGDDLFKTDILNYLGIDKTDYQQLINQSINDIEESFDFDNIKNTTEIGDFGEGLAVGHECMRIKIGGREDLIHLIQKIPTPFAVGYDIQSVELDGRKRYVEVKTTVSNQTLSFYNFHLTPNEWSTAETLQDRYFVYRLMISKTSKKLFIIQNPVGHYKNDNLKMIPKDGANIVFNEKSGQWIKLLIWNS